MSPAQYRRLRRGGARVARQVVPTEASGASAAPTRRWVRYLLGSALALAAPTPALAEEASGGIQLLLPSMAEFVPACIAFLIIFIVMSKVAWPSVLKMLDEREAKIASDLDDAAQAKATAEARADEASAQLADAARQAADIVAHARRDAETERSAILAQAQRDASAIISKSREAIELERHKAAAEVSTEVADLAAEIATKVVGDELTDEQQHRLATARRVLSSAALTQNKGDA